MRSPKFEMLMENKYSGGEYQEDLIGGMKTDGPKYQQELTRLSEITQARGYRPKPGYSLPFREAAEIAEKFPSGDPANPEKDFARELRLAIAEKLGLEKDEDLNQLRFYTAVGGPLDAHGVDGFFTLFYTDKDNRVKKCVVSFDVTRNPNKDEAARADLLIGGDIQDPSDPDFKEKEYLATIDEYAAKFAKLFQEKMEKGEVGFTKALH